MRSLLFAPLALAACVSEKNLGDSPPEPVFGAARWALTLGGIDEDGASALAVDAAGDVVIAGFFERTVDLGAGPVTVPAENPGSFLIKRRAVDGSHVWARTITGYSSYIAQVVPYDDGGVVAIGTYGGTVDFGGTVLTTEQGVHGDLFVARYSAAGELVWVRGLDPVSDAQPGAVAVGSAGTIFVAGAFRGTIDLGEGPIENVQFNESDAFVVAFSDDGELLWGNVYQGRATQYATSIAVAPDGDLVVAGWLSAEARFGNGFLQPDAYQRMFATRLTSSGEHVWARLYGPSGGRARSAPVAIGIDESGHVAVLGGETADHDDSPTKLRLRRLDAAGGEVWAREPDDGDVVPHALAIAADGGILVGGFVNDVEADLGSGVLTHGMAIAAFDADGTPRDGRSFDDRPPASDVLRALAPLPDGGLAFAGYFDRSIDFGTGAQPSAGNSEVAIVVLDPPAPE